MAQIDYLVKNVEMPPLNCDAVKSWLVEVAHSHNKNVGRLTYVFCDDDYIIDVNRQYLHHDYYTDIITFDYSNLRRISGDMVISIDTVASNALQLGVSFRTELLRVLVHGVLHLCGINDKGPGERAIMEQHENAALLITPNNIYL